MYRDTGVDPVVVPEWKSKPKRALIAVLTTFATGVPLILYAFFCHTLRKARGAPDSARKLAPIIEGFRGLLGHARS